MRWCRAVRGGTGLAGGTGALLLVHLAATLLIAGWLRRGEIAVFALIQAVALLLWRGCAALLAWALPGPAAPERPWTGTPGAPLAAKSPREVLRAATRRRGPPVLVPA